MSARKIPGIFLLAGLIGLLYVHKIVAQDTVAVQWKQLDTGLSGAKSIEITPFSTLYIVEERKNRLLKLDISGTRIDSLGTMGFGDYQFANPVDVDATNGLKIYVSDYNNRRIQIYDRRLQYLTTIKPRDDQNFFNFYKPTQLAVNSMLELHFYDEANRTIIKYNFQGELDFTYSPRLEDIALPPVDLETIDNQLLVADQKQGVVHRLAENGRYINFWGKLGNIKGISARKSRIWVLSDDLLRSFNNRGLDEKKYWLKPVKSAVDITVSDKYLFLITPESLWRAFIPVN